MMLGERERTAKDHDEGGEPLAGGAERARDVSVLEGCDFGAVDPAGA